MTRKMALKRDGGAETANAATQSASTVAQRSTIVVPGVVQPEDSGAVSEYREQLPGEGV